MHNSDTQPIPEEGHVCRKVEPYMVAIGGE